MTKLKQQDYGLMDIPLSCSIFLERALCKYIRINKTTKNFLHDWNCALLDILKSSHYNIHIGADACRTYSYANLRFKSGSVQSYKNTRTWRVVL